MADRQKVTIVLTDLDNGRVQMDMTYSPSVDMKDAFNTKAKGAVGCAVAAHIAIDEWKRTHDPKLPKGQP